MTTEIVMSPNPRFPGITWEGLAVGDYFYRSPSETMPMVKLSDTRWSYIDSIGLPWGEVNQPNKSGLIKIHKLEIKAFV